MAHYAFLDENNIVTEVITGRNENEIVGGVSDWEKHYADFRGQRCVRTSYNNNIRKQYAVIGYTYDEVADVFISIKPYPSWILDDNYDWKAPVQKPSEDGSWEWNEAEQKWDR